MKSYSSREILQTLNADGWYIEDVKGDHYQLKHPKKKGKVTVTHPKKDIPLKTVKSIFKQAGLELNQPPTEKIKNIGEVIILKDRYFYPAIFDVADEGISIEFPDLPGCLPCADTIEEAIKNAKEAMSLHLYGMEKDGDPIPEPTEITKLELEKNQFVVMVDAWMIPFRDEMKNRSIKKTLTIPKWLDDLASENNVNFSHILQDALKDYLGLKKEYKN